jgi:hypothetical protein
MNERRHLPVIRPRTVGDCRNGPRPCPHVGCRFNLLIDVLEDGSIVINAKYRRPEGAMRVIAPKPETTDRFLDEIEDAIEVWYDDNGGPPVKSCVLDETMDQFSEDAQLDEIAALMFVSRERVRQIEATALAKLRARCSELGITMQDLLDVLQNKPGSGINGTEDAT